MTLTEKLDRIPPAIARLLAKHNGRLMTTPELVRRTGFGHDKVQRIANQKTWARISVEDVDIFLTACGLSWSTQRKKRWLLKLALSKGRLHKMHHLKASNSIEATQVRCHLRRIEKLLQQL